MFNIKSKLFEGELPKNANLNGEKLSELNKAWISTNTYTHTMMISGTSHQIRRIYSLTMLQHLLAGF